MKKPKPLPSKPSPASTPAHGNNEKLPPDESQQESAKDEPGSSSSFFNMKTPDTEEVLREASGGVSDSKGENLLAVLLSDHDSINSVEGKEEMTVSDAKVDEETPPKESSAGAKRKEREDGAQGQCEQKGRRVRARKKSVHQ